MNTQITPTNTTIASTDLDVFDSPFLVQHLRQEEGAGHFVPNALLAITPALRTSGLLATLSDTNAKTLLTLLTFLTPNGNIRPSLYELAEALGCTEEALHDQIEPLTRVLWHEEPLVQPLPDREGYTISSKLIRHLPAEEPKDVSDEHFYRPAGRDAVIAASRQKYARPRAEVEAEIERALGHRVEEKEDSPMGEAWRRLVALGVSREQVDNLLMEHGTEEALKQLNWLPERNAKSPARFVVAAIEGHYSAPGTHRTAPRLNPLHGPRLDPLHGLLHPRPERRSSWSGTKAADISLPVPRNIDADIPTIVDTPSTIVDTPSTIVDTPYAVLQQEAAPFPEEDAFTEDTRPADVF
jgi:hypothetical protein